MKFRLLVLVIACLMLANVAEAQEEAKTAEIGLYYQNLVVEDGAPTHRLFLQGYDYFTERLGVWGFAYGEQEYFSGVAGFYYDFIQFGEDSVIELGVATGIERFKNEAGDYQPYARYAGTLYIGNDRLFSETYYEYGPSGEGWLRAEAQWQAKKFIALGVLHQTGDGTGPRVILSIPKTPLRVWPAVMFGEDGRKLLVGGELVISKKE